MKLFNKLHLYSILSISTATSSLSALGQDAPPAYRGITVSEATFTSKAGSGKVVYAKPKERIRGEAYVLSPGRPQVVVGIAGIDVQSGISGAPFLLRAPETPGIYEIRFNVAELNQPNADLRNWKTPQAAPPYETTLGLIVVTLDPLQTEKTLNDDNWRSWLYDNHF